MNKIFIIGLSKTGTNSVCDALEYLGYNLIHYPHAEFLTEGYLNKRDGAADLPVVRYYQKLDEMYPGSKFIMTMRPLDDWIASIESHFARRPEKTLSPWGKENRVAVYGSIAFDQDAFTKKYMAHADEVFNYFADRREDLVLLNLFTDQNPWRTLISGLGIDREVPEIDFPRSNVDPKKQAKVDVVYPFYAAGSNDELRYSMRSMEENFTSLRNIWVIGDKPDWASEEVCHIPYAHPKTLPSNEYSKNRNFAEKMLRAAMTSDITTDFVYAADDHYLLRPWSLEDFTKKVLIREDLNAFTEDYLNPDTRPWGSLSEWQTALWNTYDKMMLFGYYGWNYETHTPKLINKVNLIKTLAQFGIGDGRCMWQTAYFNMHWPTTTGLDSEKSDIKAGFYSEVPKEDMLDRLDRATFLSHNDDGLTEDLRNAIMERFPKKSRYEK